jgi:alpha-amylase/alpha-mannosidase (GH57 family)
MAYNRENFLTRVLEIQELVLQYRKKGLFFKEIFHQHVEKQFHISKRTFDEYLGINAKKQLKELRETKNINNQLKLF